MPFLDRIPILNKCCGCVTDLKTASAIIAILGIVTSPVVSWAVVRHAYVVRISCAVSTTATSPDVVDINLNNALSFGFGANAGLGASCLSKNPSDAGKDDKTKSIFVQTVKYSGWIVLLADVVFLCSAINFLSKMYKFRSGVLTHELEAWRSRDVDLTQFTPRDAPPYRANSDISLRENSRGPDKSATLVFLVSGLVSVILTFIYGILYVAACVFVGGIFPVLELLFAFIDLIMWIYYLMVVLSYRRRTA